MRRFNRYLNKCLFINQDPYIKKKYIAFNKTRETKRKTNFFERMHKDVDKR